MSEPLRVLSLGAGVQSSTLLLMAARGDIGPMPDAAIFADTQWEPRGVYEWLNFLETSVGHIIPIRRVTIGRANFRSVTPAGFARAVFEANANTRIEQRSNV